MTSGQVVVGKIKGPWGLRGVVRVTVETDIPERFTPGSEILANGSPLLVEWVRQREGDLLVQFQGICSRTIAEGLGRANLTILETSIRPLPPDCYYHYQLLGLRVITTEDEELGVISDILSTGSDDVFVATQSDGQEILIPASADVVREVIVVEGYMRVELLPGLR